MKKLHTKRSISVNGGQNARTCPYKDDDVVFLIRGNVLSSLVALIRRFYIWE